MNSLRIKKGDNVLIIAGKENGKTGQILTVNHKNNTVIVKGINMISKHQKPRSAQDKGGIIKLEGKIHGSNVQVICPKCNKATRIAIKVTDDKKSRVCKKCDATLDVAKASKAKKATTTKKAKTTTATTAVKKPSTTKKAPAKKATTAKKASAKPVAAKKSSATAKKAVGNK